MTDRVARVLAAMAAGGGTAVTIGPPSTTGEATALIACVVAMAVAEVDAVIEMLDGTGIVVDTVNVGAAVNVGVVVNVGAAVNDGVAVDDGELAAAATTADVFVFVVVVVADTTTDLTPISGGGGRVTTGFGGASGLDDATAAVNCFLGKRGEDLTGGRLGIGFVAVDLPATASATAGCVRLRVLGDLSGSGDLGGTGLRGVGDNFLRGDDFTDAGTAGGFPVAVGVFRPPLAADGSFVYPEVRLPATDRSFVDADNRFPSVAVAMTGGRRRSPTIRGSDD